MLFNEVRDFANRFTETKIEIYSRRNQNDLEKIFDDCFSSKLAEWAAYKYLSKFKDYAPSQYPTMTILDKPNWDADLFNAQYKFAVKNCKRSNRYGISWTFQSNQPRDPILDLRDPRYKIVFVIMDAATRFEIYGTSDTQEIADDYRFDVGEDKPELEGIKLFVKANRAHSIKIIRAKISLP